MMLKKILTLLLVTLISLTAFAINPKTSDLKSKTTKNNMEKNTVYTLRLSPGEDLQKSLSEFIEKNSLKAASIVTAVGSLTTANIRYANQPSATKLEGHFEIVSLVGTLSHKSGSHLHLSISDETGKTMGGHLMEGNKIYTTAEITLLEQNDKEFIRELDLKTTYKELKIISR